MRFTHISKRPRSSQFFQITQFSPSKEQVNHLLSFDYTLSLLKRNKEVSQLTIKNGQNGFQALRVLVQGDRREEAVDRAESIFAGDKITKERERERGGREDGWRGGQGRRHGRSDEGSTARRRLEDRPAHRQWIVGQVIVSQGKKEEEGKERERERERKKKEARRGKRARLLSPRELDAPISRAWLASSSFFPFLPDPDAVLLSPRGDRNGGVWAGCQR